MEALHYQQEGVIWIFHWLYPSGHTMALGLTQPITEMSTRYVSWGGKGGRSVGLTTIPHSSSDCLEGLVASTSWRSNGLSRPVQEYIKICKYSTICLIWTYHSCSLEYSLLGNYSCLKTRGWIGSNINAWTMLPHHCHQLLGPVRDSVKPQNSSVFCLH